MEDLVPQKVKGIDGDIDIYRVAGESTAESRFEATHQTGLTPLVGRETEIAMLLERWEQAKDGDGQVVLLSGEPGIGKSRITQTLRERIGEEPHIRIYACATNVLLFTPTLLSIRSSSSYRGRRVSTVTTDPRLGSTSWKNC